jgi:hypothetical protein
VRCRKRLESRERAGSHLPVLSLLPARGHFALPSHLEDREVTASQHGDMPYFQKIDRIRICYPMDHSRGCGFKVTSVRRQRPELSSS